MRDDLDDAYDTLYAGDKDSIRSRVFPSSTEIEDAAAAFQNAVRAGLFELQELAQASGGGALETLIDEYARVADDVEGDPRTLVDRRDPFRRAEEQAKKLGLTGCD